VRNWTYVDDIVEGTLLAAERIDDASAVNLGSMERITVFQAARLTQDLTGHRAPILARPEMPTGPLNRVADGSRAERLLEWSSQTPFREGLRRTIDWYFSSKDRGEVARLIERGGLMAAHGSSPIGSGTRDRPMRAIGHASEHREAA
jgi:nucleoside-diphosphate-sugar epimerase